MKTKTILELFAEGMKKNDEALKALEKEQSGKMKDQEKDLAHIRAELEKERTLWAKLQTEYDSIEAEVETEVRAGLEKTENTRAKVDRGEITLAAFMANNLSEKDLRLKATTGAREKLAAAIRFLREKKAKIYELEVAEATAVYNLAYLVFSVPELRLKNLKYEIESFTQNLNPLANALAIAQQSREKAKINFRLTQGNRTDNLNWDSLGVDEIRGLLFDPRIGEDRFPEIEEFLSTADPDEKYRVTYSVYPPAYIQFRVLGIPRIAKQAGEPPEKK
jgi:hypothetical protein